MQCCGFHRLLGSESLFCQCVTLLRKDSGIPSGKEKVHGGAILSSLSNPCVKHALTPISRFRHGEKAIMGALVRHKPTAHVVDSIGHSLVRKVFTGLRDDEWPTRAAAPAFCSAYSFVPVLALPWDLPAVCRGLEQQLVQTPGLPDVGDGAETARPVTRGAQDHPRFGHPFGPPGTITWVSASAVLARMQSTLNRIRNRRPGPRQRLRDCCWRERPMIIAFFAPTGVTGLLVCGGSF